MVCSLVDLVLGSDNRLVNVLVLQKYTHRYSMYAFPMYDLRHVRFASNTVQSGLTTARAWRVRPRISIRPAEPHSALPAIGRRQTSRPRVRLARGQQPERMEVDQRQRWSPAARLPELRRPRCR